MNLLMLLETTGITTKAQLSLRSTLLLSCFKYFREATEGGSHDTPKHPQAKQSILPW